MPRRPSLETQCEQIGWPIRVMHANYLGNKRWTDDLISDFYPEELVSARITAEGGMCSWCEGGSINLLIKAAALDALAKRNLFNDRTDAIRRFLEAQCTTLKEFETELLTCIRNVTLDRLSGNINEICDDQFIQEAYPRVRRDFLHLLVDVLKIDELTQIATVFMRNPYDYRSGWPDLTVIESGLLSFVEVKTTDLFHNSQLRFAEEIAKPLKLSCSTIQLKASA
jgi:hypothetical protein